MNDPVNHFKSAIVFKLRYYASKHHTDRNTVMLPLTNSYSCLARRSMNVSPFLLLPKAKSARIINSYSKKGTAQNRSRLHLPGTRTATAYQKCRLTPRRSRQKPFRCTKPIQNNFGKKVKNARMFKNGDNTFLDRLPFVLSAEERYAAEEYNKPLYPRQGPYKVAGAGEHMIQII